MGFVKVADIVSIASDGDYALTRVHRATIVNLESVVRVEEWSHLSYLLYLRGSSDPVAMSRRYAGRLKK